MKRAICLFVALGATFGAAVASAQLPDSPTGRRGNALLKAVRGGNEALSDDFLRQNFSDDYLAAIPVDERVVWLRSTLSDLGPIAIEGASKTGPFSVTLMGTSANGERVEIRYAIEEDEPHRITSLDIETFEALAPIAGSELESAADELVAHAAEAGDFSGVALIARGDEVLFEKAYGLANRRYGAPNTIETAFNLGSINKIFTKMAIAQLAAADKLSLDDTVAEHLPDYPNLEVAERITIRQVVNHTAGLGDIFTEGFSAASKRRFQQPEDYFELFADDPLLFEPGEGEAYSNGGYMVLGAIVAAASGQSYRDYVRQNIFIPAGMNDTHPYALDDPTAPIATGYTESSPGHETAPVHENSFHIPHTGTPAGGGYSTARDLLAFRNALLAGDLLDTRYTAWMLTDELPETAPERTERVGLGIAGGGPGVNAMLEMSDDWTIVVLSNLDPPTAGEIAKGLRELTQAVERAED